MGVTERLLGVIAVEIAFWVIAGIIAIFIHKLVSSTYVFVLAFVVLVLLAHYLDRKYSAVKCLSCGAVFRNGELKK
jgi:hypothetical protein